MCKLRTLLLLALLAVGFTTPRALSEPATAKDAGTLMICGGGLTLENTNAPVSVAFKSLAASLAPGRKPVLASIQSGSASSYSAKKNWDSAKDDPGYAEMFANLGFSPFLVPLALDNYDSPSYLTSTTDGAVAESKEWAAKVEAADVVFLNGGDQIRHVRALLRDDGSDSLLMTAIRKVLARGGLLMGTSAGDHAQGQGMFGGGISYSYLASHYVHPLSGQDQFPKVDYERNHANLDKGSINGTDGFVIDEKTKERSPLVPSLRAPNDPDENLGSYGVGLNLIQNVLLDSHVGTRGRIGRTLVALQAVHEDPRFPATTTAVAVDEDTCVVWNRATHDGRVVGARGVWLLDISHAKLNAMGTAPFKSSGIGFSYLTAGDTFSLNADNTLGPVVSVKPGMAVKPKGSKNFTGDIFGKNQLVKAMKMLVEDCPGEVLAMAQPPKSSATPALTPLSVTFRLLPSTKLYAAPSSGGITIDRAEMRIGQ